MGSPISSLIIEIFLQFCEDRILKSNLGNKKISFYNRYIDDILLVFDSHKTTADEIQNYMNRIHQHVKFKPTLEEDKSINFLDLTLTRNTNTITANIYRKPRTTDTTIRYTSNHPIEHKLISLQISSK